MRNRQIIIGLQKLVAIVALCAGHGSTRADTFQASPVFGGAVPVWERLQWSVAYLPDNISDTGRTNRPKDMATVNGFGTLGSRQEEPVMGSARSVHGQLGSVPLTRVQPGGLR